VDEAGTAGSRLLAQLHTHPVLCALEAEFLQEGVSLALGRTWDSDLDGRTPGHRESAGEQEVGYVGVEARKGPIRITRPLALRIR